jgi:hypothetical protein
MGDSMPVAQRVRLDDEDAAQPRWPMHTIQPACLESRVTLALPTGPFEA